MSLEPLCPDLVTWRIAAIAPARDRLVLHLEPVRRIVACPVCGTRSQRVHSQYRRKPWDLPWGRWSVQLVVQARRFFCDELTCPRWIFVGPFPTVLARYARQTERLRQVLLELAHGSSAEMAARLATWLGYITSPDTFIRRQRAEGTGQYLRQLYRELIDHGYKGCESQVRALVRPWRATRGVPSGRTLSLPRLAGPNTPAERREMWSELAIA
jgi:hypothetical protein